MKSNVETGIFPSIRPFSEGAMKIPRIEDLLLDVNEHLQAAIPSEVFDSYVFEEEEVIFEQRLHLLRSFLPSITWSIDEEKNDCMVVSIVGLRLPRFSSEDFAKKLLVNWLVPEKGLHLLAQRQLDFVFERSSNAQYYFYEMYIELDRDQDRLYAINNMPGIVRELRRGLISSIDAFAILNTKGISNTEKDAFVANEIKAVFERRPLEFDKTVLQDIQQYLFQYPAEFKQYRGITHIARVVCSQYVYRRTLLQLTNLNPSKRHVCLKIFRTSLYTPYGQKKVLGFLLGFNLINVNREVLEEKHLLEAIQNIVPDVVVVKGSFQEIYSGTPLLKMVYIEVAREDALSFSTDEVISLRSILPKEIRHHIEHLVPVTFMRRNEEEVYRNIVTLRDQIQYVKDMPQVFISFEEQTGKDLFFTVVLLRVLQSEDQPTVEELFTQANPGYIFIPDRRETVGYVRKKYPKEANVFRLQIPKNDYLRKDRSVDLYKARNLVNILLQNACGQVRDYNGGLIVKQDERLQDFIKQLPSEDPFLLENFFYSITPIAMQGVIQASFLRAFYQLFRKVHATDIPQNGSYVSEWKEDRQFITCMFRSDDGSLKDALEQKVSEFELGEVEWASSKMNLHGTFSFGYILLTHDEHKRARFQAELTEVVQQWNKEILQKQQIRINLAFKSPTIDSRVSRRDDSAVIVRMLYEGLTRMGSDKVAQPALAQRIEISDDGMKYVFHLRDSTWSDGSAVTARDFVSSWKKAIAKPKHQLVQYTFGAIKNVKRYFRGEGNLDDIGVSVIDDKTLEVLLEQPTPSFLEYTAHWTYLPTHSSRNENQTQWVYYDGASYVSNGPFKLREWKQNRELVVVKNELYWDADSVHLEQITVNLADNPFIELKMFENGEIDMTGSGIKRVSTEKLLQKQHSEEFVTHEIAAVYGLWMNTEIEPFSNANFRRALHFAIDKDALQEHLLFGEESASSFMPRSILPHTDTRPSQDIAAAKKYLARALDELCLTKEQLPIIQISYSGIRRKTVCEFVRSAWETLLGLEVRIEEYDWLTLSSNMASGRYQVSGMSWISWFWDPAYLLSCFSTWVGPGHITKWTDPEYARLVERASIELDSEKRMDLFRQAERMLYDQQPMIPLHNCTKVHFVKPHIKNVRFSALSEVDMKWAYLEREL